MELKQRVAEQVERILDEASTQQVEVIVQMQGSPSRRKRLAQAAGKALARRHMSITPRELLPGHHRKTVSAQQRLETASAHQLLGRGSSSLSMPALKGLRSGQMKPLLSHKAVRSSRSRGKSRQFLTSGSVLLTMHRDELVLVRKEVAGIEGIHVNRSLKVPSTLEMKPLGVESSDTLSSTWGLLRSNALATWGAYNALGSGVKIGVLDTGIDPTHPDLAGKISNWAEFDFDGTLVSSDVTAAFDSDEHGTHVAGTLVGEAESGRFIGMAPQARLAAALVLKGEQGGTDAQVLAGIDWAVQRGVDVLSMSLGGLVMDSETPPTYTEAILTCLEMGIPVVTAIGNEGQQTSGSPGNDLFAFSVGATDPTDRPAGFSGGRTQIIRESEFIHEDFLPLPYSKPEVTAPGVGVFSSVPGGGYKAFSGTSMATPHVAGAIALLLSATSIRQKETGADRTFLIQDLISGAVEDLGESGQDHRYGFGRLDVLRAIDFAHERGYA